MSGREEQMEDWENESGGRGWSQTEVEEKQELEVREAEVQKRAVGVVERRMEGQK